MNGWFRLWIVVSILALIAVVVTTAVNWTPKVPSYVTKADDIRANWIYNLKDSIISEPDKDEFFYLIVSKSWDIDIERSERFFLEGSVEELAAALEVSNDLVAEETHTLFRHKYSERLAIQERWDVLRIFMYRFTPLLVWVLGVGLLYLSGWTFGWVRKGFKSH